MTGMTAINCIVAHFAEKSYKKSLHDTENFTVLPIICFWYGRQTVAKNGQRIFLQVDTTIMIFYGFNKQKIRLMEQIAIRRLFFELCGIWHRLRQSVDLKSRFHQGVYDSGKSPMVLFDFFNKPCGFPFSVNAIACNIGKELVAVFIFCPATSVREAGVERMLLRKHQNAAAV